LTAGSPGRHLPVTLALLPGDLVGELRAFIAAGMDGFFTDNPDLGVIAATA